MGVLFAVVVLALIVGGVVLGWRSLRGDRWIVERTRFHLVLAPLFLIGCYVMMQGAQRLGLADGRRGEFLGDRHMEMIATRGQAPEAHPFSAIPGWAMLIMIFMAFVWTPYTVQVFAYYITDAIPHRLMGDHKLVTEPTYDAGDAAMKRGDLRGALALYAAESARAGDHPDAWLRMAEAHRAMGEPRSAIDCERRASSVATDPDRRGPILLMLSQHLIEAGEPASAREVVEAVLAEPALAAYHAAARLRLAAAAGSGPIPPRLRAPRP